jgi:hypothetical protein
MCRENDTLLSKSKIGVYFCVVLFYFQELLEVLCSAAAAKMSNPCEKLPLILRSILTSVGQIRFRSKELLDEVYLILFENIH